MKHRSFAPVKMPGQRYIFTLEDGRTVQFRMPTAIMLRPLFDALQLVPDEGAVPSTVRDALILEAAGTVIGYLWDDSAVTLGSNWRTMPTFSEYGASVVDELMIGCEAKGKDDYTPWSIMDLLNCLSDLTKELNSTFPTEQAVAENANFT